MTKEFTVSSKRKVKICGRWETVFGRIRRYKTLEEAKAAITKYCETQAQKNEPVISWSIKAREVTPWEVVDSYDENK